MAGATRTEILDVSLDKLWDAITDYESYPDFLEGVESLSIVKKEGKHTYAEYVVSMFGKKVKYILKHTEQPKKAVKWTMDSGEFFKSNDGSWALKELDDGTVEATYNVEVGLPLLIPGAKMIVNTLTNTQLPAMMKAFEKRAKSLGKKSSGKEKAKDKKK